MTLPSDKGVGVAPSDDAAALASSGLSPAVSALRVPAANVDLLDTVAAHLAWRKRVARAMPEACARVFALRGQLYSGCGFHYALERALGSTMRMANDMESGGAPASRIGAELIVEEFYRDLALAEKSAAQLVRKS